MTYIFVDQLIHLWSRVPQMADLESDAEGIVVTAEAQPRSDPRCEEAMPRVGKATAVLIVSGTCEASLPFGLRNPQMLDYVRALRSSVNLGAPSDENLDSRSSVAVQAHGIAVARWELRLRPLADADDYEGVVLRAMAEASVRLRAPSLR